MPSGTAFTPVADMFGDLGLPSMEEMLGASNASASDVEAASLEVGAAPKSSDAIAPMRMEVQSDNEDSTDSDDEDSLSQPHEMPNVLILHVGQLSPNAKTPHLKLLMQQGSVVFLLPYTTSCVFLCLH